jgi:hypothetical protein
MQAVPALAGGSCSRGRFLILCKKVGARAQEYWTPGNDGSPVAGGPRSAGTGPSALRIHRAWQVRAARGSARTNTAGNGAA